MYKLSPVSVLKHNRGVAHRFSTNDQGDVEKLQEIRKCCILMACIKYLYRLVVFVLGAYKYHPEQNYFTLTEN
jgi:hypothetical protein